MFNFISKLFGGSKSERDVKSLSPLVQEINEYYNVYHQLSDEQLASKTQEFREIIRTKTLELETEKSEIEQKLRNDDLNPSEFIDLHDRIKELDDAIFTTVEETLDEILPQAFATVKEVARRLKEKKHSYEYAGHTSTWDMVPYDVQLMGGISIHQGKISEMQTGEGKTLSAIMPMYLNALPQKGVHLITVNDYLALRDCEWMKPVFDFLGITVGAIQANQDPEVRKDLYKRDITYGTNNEFGFDYLRDNMVTDEDQMVQRAHWFAIVDEVDSVLIDEARTPLIISGAVAKVDQRFEEMNPRIKRLVDVQTKLVNQLMNDFATKFASDKKEDKEEAGGLLFTAYRGMPKHKRLLKYLQEPEVQRLKHNTELFYLREQGRNMHLIDEQLYFTVDEKNHQIDISEKGRELLCNDQEDPDMFLIPDIAAEMSAIEGNKELSPEDKQRKIDSVNLIYAERNDRIHTASQLLRAYTLYEKDVEYVVQDQKVMIVDEHTGRILDGRRYSDGLHQAIEAKENVKVERDTQTLATITLQNYFRMYNKLAGMTGTAATEAAEFEKIYNLEVVTIPTNKPISRKDQNDVIYKTKREKYNAIVNDVRDLLNENRAVLVGTASVEVSEVLSKMFQRANIRHNVLNAKNHAREAEIVSGAGKKGALTIATNMAGRGTDIKIDEEVRKAGGLAIIGSERHDSRRIDRQLRGRSGRQGDPGSSKFYISLEDNLIRLFGAGGDRIASVMEKLNIPEGEAIEHSLITKSVESAQKKVEENNFAIRKRLLDYDDVMNQQREVIYTRRRQALKGERMKGLLFEYIEELASDWYDEYHPEKDVETVISLVRTVLLCDLKLSEAEFDAIKKDDFIKLIEDTAHKFYDRKEEMVGVELMKYLEKIAVLQTIDDQWREHLRIMDELKEGIHLRSYAQKDPLLEYKSEAFKAFVNLIKTINKESVNFAFRFFPQLISQQVEEEKPKPVMPQPRNTSVTRNLKFEHSDVTPSYVVGNSGDINPPQNRPVDTTSENRTFKRTEKKYERNDLVKVRYPDGSIKEQKYKKVENEVEAGTLTIID